MRPAALLFAAALATAPAAASAQATPARVLVDAFRAICMGPSPADAAAALAAADKAGWSPVPDALLAQFAGQFTNAAGRLKSDSSGMQFLILGEQSRPVGGRSIRMKACGVGASTPEGPAVEALLQAEAGVERNAALTKGGQIAWVYSDVGGRHTRLDERSEAALLAAMSAGTARFLMKQSRPASSAPAGLTILLVAAPTI